MERDAKSLGRVSQARTAVVGDWPGLACVRLTAQVVWGIRTHAEIVHAREGVKQAREQEVRTQNMQKMEGAGGAEYVREAQKLGQYKLRATDYGALPSRLRRRKSQERHEVFRPQSRNKSAPKDKEQAETPARDSSKAGE